MSKATQLEARRFSLGSAGERKISQVVNCRRQLQRLVDESYLFRELLGVIAASPGCQPCPQLDKVHHLVPDVVAWPTFIPYPPANGPMDSWGIKDAPSKIDFVPISWCGPYMVRAPYDPIYHGVVLTAFR